MPGVRHGRAVRAEVLRRMRRGAGFPGPRPARFCRDPPRLVYPAPPRRASPCLSRRARGGAQARHGAVRGRQGIARAPGGPRSRGGPRAPRPCPRTHDGRGPPLRGHGEPGDGGRHHGPVRGADRPRGPRRPRVVCRPRPPARNAWLRRGGSPLARRRPQGSGRPQLRRSRSAHRRLGPPDGLLGRGSDHSSRRPPRAARRPREHPADGGYAPARRGARGGPTTRAGSRERPGYPGGGVRAHGGGPATLPPRRGGGARPHAIRRPGRRAGADPSDACSSGFGPRSGRRHSRRAGRRQVTPGLGSVPLTPDSRLAGPARWGRVLRKGDAVPSGARPTQGVLRRARH